MNQNREINEMLDSFQETKVKTKREILNQVNQLIAECELNEDVLLNSDPTIRGRLIVSSNNNNMYPDINFRTYTKTGTLSLKNTYVYFSLYHIFTKPNTKIKDALLNIFTPATTPR